MFDKAWGSRPGRGQVTVYLIALTGPDCEARLAAELERWDLKPADGVAGDADVIAAAVRQWGEAGADTVVLQPAEDDDPADYARFAAEQVRPRLG